MVGIPPVSFEHQLDRAHRVRRVDRRVLLRESPEKMGVFPGYGAAEGVREVRGRLNIDAAATKAPRPRRLARTWRCGCSSSWQAFSSSPAGMMQQKFSVPCIHRRAGRGRGLAA